jgi:hypothetical protein
LFIYSTDPFNTDEMARKGDKTEKPGENKFCPAYLLKDTVMSVIETVEFFFPYCFFNYKYNNG